MCPMRMRRGTRRRAADAVLAPRHCFSAATSRPRPFCGQAKTGNCRQRRPILWSIVEGMLWGLAVWIKPHVLVPALVVWLVSLRFETRRAAIVDAIALLFGGAIVGGRRLVLAHSDRRVVADVGRAPELEPGILLVVVGQPLPQGAARLRLLRAVQPVALRRRSRWQSMRHLPTRSGARDPRRPLPRLAGAGDDHSEGIRLRACAADACSASPCWRRFAGRSGRSSWRGVCSRGLRTNFASESEWPCVQARTRSTTRVIAAASPNRPRRSAGALAPLLARRVVGIEGRTHLLSRGSIAPNWADLAARGRVPGDEESARSRVDLLARFDAPALRLARHQAGHSLSARHHGDEVQVEARTDSRARRSRARHDTSSATWCRSSTQPRSARRRPRGPANALPPEFPEWGADVYPWNQPVVFRAGRYFVHEVKNPRGEIVFPLPKLLAE